MVSDDSREYDNNNNTNPDQSFSFNGIGNMSFLKDLPPVVLSKQDQKLETINKFNESIDNNELKTTFEEEKY